MFSYRVSVLAFPKQPYRPLLMNSLHLFYLLKFFSLLMTYWLLLTLFPFLLLLTLFKYLKSLLLNYIKSQVQQESLKLESGGLNRLSRDDQTFFSQCSWTFSTDKYIELINETSLSIFKFFAASWIMVKTKKIHR